MTVAHNRERPLRLGLFGGTFDPIHNGHLYIADGVRDRLNLTKILFMPAGQPWLKKGRRITTAAHRLQMVHLAITGKPYFEVSSIEIERPGATYTVDTLIELFQERGDFTVYVILGFDALRDFSRWKDPARLLELGYLVAVPRPGYVLPDIKRMYISLPRLEERLLIMDFPEVDISASVVRQRIASHQPFEDLVPPRVAEYIKRNQLYLYGKTI